MTEERRRAIWAIYGTNNSNHAFFKCNGAHFRLLMVLPSRCHSCLLLIRSCFSNRELFLSSHILWSTVWCRRTDELVDGPNASHITPGALDRWEERLEEAFQCRPYDMFDAALSHTVVQYPLSIQVSDHVGGLKSVFIGLLNCILPSNDNGIGTIGLF